MDKNFDEFEGFEKYRNWCKHCDAPTPIQHVYCYPCRRIWYIRLRLYLIKKI